MTVQIQHQRPSWQSALSFLANNSDPAMALKAPEFMIDTFKKFQPPPDIDLEGGTLLSVEETEEIDPMDNCKVQVTKYHILSADGTEESTITKKRKLKVNCTQSLKRLEFCNGKEAKFEEKTEILTGDLDGFQPKQLQHRSSQFALDHTNPQDQAISNTLLRTQDTFMTLLHQKKDEFLEMFPDLFASMRTRPAIFDSPGTTTETIINPDGTTVTRMKSSKQFSSHYTRHETYVNGVKQESKCKFRAFMEYQGPEGGFSIRLNDNPEADLSEDENENEDFDGTSRISRSVSEIPDTMSAMVSYGNKVPKITPLTAKTKRYDKAWHSVNELVESENRYVQKLALLDKVRDNVLLEMNFVFSFEPESKSKSY
uniref:DH domain-containing protein n=2 Tax=Acrobeloides nanus TaxID=290746 RepID=A0A914CED2_9BILA